MIYSVLIRNLGKLMGAQLKTYKEEALSFRRRQKHALAKTIKLIDKETEVIVETLVELLKSEDEKVRLQAAAKLMDYQIAIAEHINRDEIQRVLLELKNPTGSRGLVEDDNSPSIDFSTIQNIE